MNNVTLRHAEGVYLSYSDGSRVIDASNTGAPLGHGYPAMVEAVKEASSLPVANEGQPWFERECVSQKLADLLNQAAGEDWVGRVVFGLSGSEVNDMALSLSQALTGREPIAVRERAYHGLVGLSRDATVQPQWHCGLSFSNPPVVKKPPRSTEVHVIPAPDGSSWERRPAEKVTIDSLEESCRNELEDAAAIIVDYTQGGRYYDGPAYQDTVARCAQEKGALWIADEVVTGLGRSGSLFAFGEGTTVPDIVTMGKPLAGGASPAGAVILSKRVASMMGEAKWQNYSTFRGHPLTIHAIGRYLDVVESEGLVQRAREAGTYCEKVLTELATAHPCVNRVAGRGLHWTMEFEGEDWRTWTSTDSEQHISDVIVAGALAAGARFSTSDEPSSIFFAPSLIIAKNELDQIFHALDIGLSKGDAFLDQA